MPSKKPTFSPTPLPSSKALVVSTVSVTFANLPAEAVSNSSVLQEALCGAVGKALSVESEGDVRYLRAQSMLMMGSVDSMVELEARSEYDASSTAGDDQRGGSDGCEVVRVFGDEQSYAGPGGLESRVPGGCVYHVHVAESSAERSSYGGAKREALCLA